MLYYCCYCCCTTVEPEPFICDHTTTFKPFTRQSNPISSVQTDSIQCCWCWWLMMLWCWYCYYFWCYCSYRCCYCCCYWYCCCCCCCYYCCYYFTMVKPFMMLFFDPILILIQSNPIQSIRLICCCYCYTSLNHLKGWSYVVVVVVAAALQHATFEPFTQSNPINPTQSNLILTIKPNWSDQIQASCCCCSCSCYYCPLYCSTESIVCALIWFLDNT